MYSSTLIVLLSLLGLGFGLPNIPAGDGKLVELNEDNWSQILQGEWMIEFHAPWCPACRALQPQWKEFSTWSSDLGIGVGAVEITVNPGLSGRFLVTALPTIYHVKDGIFRIFKGTRDVKTFTDFVELKKWQSIEPVSSWTAPQSFQMTLVSNLFKVSMVLRSVHTQMVDHYGVPYWGSYVLFAVFTIVIGALLGLLIVYVIDLFWPSTPAPAASQPKPSQKAEFKEVDNVEDDSAMATESAKESSGSEESDSKKKSPQQTPELRKRRPRKD